MPNITNITPPRVPITDPATGMISREWYRFFLNMFTLLGGGAAPDTGETMADLQMPVPQTVDELVKELSGLAALPAAGDTAELRKALDALALAPARTPHAPQLIYGSFYSTENQADGSTTTAYPIIYTTTQTAKNVALENRTAAFTASIALTTMTVTAVASGPIYPGMLMSGTGIAAGTRVVSQTSGTTGSTGVYEVSVSQTLSSRAFTGACASILRVYRQGVYNVQYSAQFLNTDTAATHDIDIWLRKNGADVSDTNSKFSVPQKHSGENGHVVGALNLFVDLLPNDYVELMWATSDPGALIGYIAARTGPVRPFTPSIITTVSCVSGPTD